MNLIGIVLCFLIALIGLFVCLIGLVEASTTAEIVGFIVSIIGVTGIILNVRERRKKRELKKSPLEEPEIKELQEVKQEVKKVKKKKDIKRENHEESGSWTGIDYVVVAGQQSRAKAGSAIARGAIGKALIGPIGLLAAACARKNTKVTLVIHYNSGRVKTKTVNLGSIEFKHYAKYIR